MTGFFMRNPRLERLVLGFPLHLLFAAGMAALILPLIGLFVVMPEGNDAVPFLLVLLFSLIPLFASTFGLEARRFCPSLHPSYEVGREHDAFFSRLLSSLPEGLSSDRARKLCGDEEHRAAGFLLLKWSHVVDRRIPLDVRRALESWATRVGAPPFSPWEASGIPAPANERLSDEDERAVRILSRRFPHV